MHTPERAQEKEGSFGRAKGARTVESELADRTKPGTLAWTLSAQTASSWPDRLATQDEKHVCNESDNNIEADGATPLLLLSLLPLLLLLTR